MGQHAAAPRGVPRPRRWRHGAGLGISGIISCARRGCHLQHACGASCGHAAGTGRRAVEARHGAGSCAVLRGGVGSGPDTAARHRWESCATSLAAATSAASSSICMVRWPRTVAATRMAICTMLTHPRPPIRNFVTLHLDRLGRAMPMPMPMRCCVAPGGRGANIKFVRHLIFTSV